MPVKLNSEFNYRTQVIGETIWEKIKTLQGFLEGRKRAAFLEKVTDLKYEAKLEKLKYLEGINAPKHEILEAQADIREADSFMPNHRLAYELNKEEIAMLERLIAEAYVIAEPTRIKGYSDEQMFEANACNEFTVMIGKEIQAEIIANGRPSSAKIRNAMSNPTTFKALQKAGLIPVEAKVFIGNNDPLQIELKMEE